MDDPGFREAAAYFSEKEQEAESESKKIHLNESDRNSQPFVNANLAVAELMRVRLSLDQICEDGSPIIDDETLEIAKQALDMESGSGIYIKYDSNQLYCIAMACKAAKIAYEMGL